MQFEFGDVVLVLGTVNALYKRCINAEELARAIAEGETET